MLLSHQLVLQNEANNVVSIDSFPEQCVALQWSHVDLIMSTVDWQYNAASDDGRLEACRAKCFDSVWLLSSSLMINDA